MSNDKVIEDILKDYLFFSKELLKFTGAEDLAVFEDLVKQRELVIDKLKPHKNDIKKDASKDLMEEIVSVDKEIYDKILKARNMLKNQFEISNVYEGLVGEHLTIGNRFDSKLN